MEGRQGGWQGVERQGGGHGGFPFNGQYLKKSVTILQSSCSGIQGVGKIPRQAVKRLPAGFDRQELYCTVLFEKNDDGEY